MEQLDSGFLRKDKKGRFQAFYWSINLGARQKDGNVAALIPTEKNSLFQNQEAQTLRIELRLYASLRKYLPGETPDGIWSVELEEGATLRNLFAKILIPPDAPKIIFLNGIHARGDEVLKEGDRVGAFPPVAGG